MVNLKAVYGDLIFSKDLYKSSKYIPNIAETILYFVLAYAIVEIFNIKGDYAFLKVYGVMFLFGLFKPILAWPIYKLNDKLFFRKAVISEVEHYLHTFNVRLKDDNSTCYEDYLLEAAFDESLDSKMRVLAAMQYMRVMVLMQMAPRMDGFYYNVWREAAPRYIKETERA